jgi:hypothetical protein
MSTEREVDLIVSLLAPLDRIEPVERGATRRHPRGFVLATAVLLAALVIVGVALAASWGPLSGIGAADHPARPSDAVSARAAAQLHHAELPPSDPVDQIGSFLVDQARLLGTLPDGSKVYAVPSSKDKLCVVVASRANECAAPLTHERPITLAIMREGPGVGPIVFGATIDDVASVSFEVGGESVMLPVNNNFYAWQGSPSQAQAGISPVTVTFADGSTAIPH